MRSVVFYHLFQNTQKELMQLKYRAKIASFCAGINDSSKQVVLNEKLLILNIYSFNMYPSPPMRQVILKYYDILLYWYIEQFATRVRLQTTVLFK